MAYAVIMTQSVLENLFSESERIQNRYFDMFDTIASSPDLGRLYEPVNGDDEPPIPCRYFHMPDTTKTIFYSVDHDSKRIKVFGFVDQRRNPAYRFREIRQTDLDDTSKAK